MRTPSRRHLVALAVVAGAVAAPSLAFADPPQPSAAPVRIEQDVTHAAGRCVYTARLRGSYRLAGAQPDGRLAVRDAVVDVGVRLRCRGAQPVESVTQVYFAQTTEDRLLARIVELATVERPARGREPSCGLVPALRRVGDALVVGELAEACGTGRVPVVASRETPAR